MNRVTEDFVKTRTKRSKIRVLLEIEKNHHCHHYDYHHCVIIITSPILPIYKRGVISISNVLKNYNYKKKNFFSVLYPLRLDMDLIFF